MRYFAKIIFGVGVAHLLLMHTACNKLTEAPYSSIFTDGFYKTAADAEGAITAAYGPLPDLYNLAGTGASDLSADQIYPRPVVGRDTYTLFSYDPNYTTQKSFARVFESPQRIWQACYTGIENANWVIYKVPTTAMDPVRRDIILGEAFFLRAFYHWTLAKNFRDVVIKVSPSINIDSAIVPKSPEADVYKQVFADLDQAVLKLPTYTSAIQKGRPSKEVAMALYAKAALYIGKWDIALEKAQGVIASGKYALMPDVTDVYNVAKEDLARQENMWALECESAVPGFGAQLNSLYGPKNSDAPAYGAATYGSLFVYQSFFDSFSPADKRRKLLDTSYINKLGQVVQQKDITPITKKGVLLKKYMDPVSPGNASNVPIFRLPDMYLIAAEATARISGANAQAYGFIKVVRDRAGLPELTPGLGQQPFIDSVLRERSWEFFGEGDRWYDLTRTNTFMLVIPQAVNDVYPVRSPQTRNRYFPIPLDEVNANSKLAQNPEWK